MLTRRSFLASAATLPLMPRPLWAAAPDLAVTSRVIEVKGKAAKVFGIVNSAGGIGHFAQEGDRFTSEVLNDSGSDLVLHWHGQHLAPNDQDRARPDGGSLAPGGRDRFDFALTPGTHWMHSHALSEQQLLAAPMVTRETFATEPEATVMLHDFTFRTPEEVLAGLGSPGGHDMSAMGSHDMASMEGMDMGGMSGMSGMSGMTHANDVAYDAYLANDRTLDDPEVIAVAPGPFRLRLINGATATAFWVDAGSLSAQAVATDGQPCRPLSAQRFPLAQGQRLDLILQIPPEGGAFPIFAQVEGLTARTGVILATPAAQITKQADQAEAAAPLVDLSLDAAASAVSPLESRPGSMLHVSLGMGPNYAWSIDTHGPLTAARGERVEIMFMNPTPMMHPMHLHGHAFQVVDLGRGRFAGPLRDTVIVPPGAMVTVAVDLDKAGNWFLHCHHLYHMAGGMMAVLNVT